MLKSQEMRKLAPEMDPLRIGTGWKKEDLEKPQIMVESTYGDSHPGSGHLNLLVEEVRKGVAEAGGFGARYFCTDICDGESQGTDGINYSLASREMIANHVFRPHNDRVDDAVHTGSRHHRKNARDHEKDHRRFEMTRHCLGNQGDGNGGKKVLHQNAVVEYFHDQIDRPADHTDTGRVAFQLFWCVQQS